MKGTREVAQRMVEAENNFCENIKRITGCTDVEAYAAFKLMLKLKVVKRDLAMSRYVVKHGAFMDASVLKNAIRDGMNQ